MSLCSNANFKSAINGHKKNILNEKETPSPCNCRDKTSWPLKESCQHKNLVYSCKVSTPNISKTIHITLELQNIQLKIDTTNITILLSAVRVKEKLNTFQMQ